MPLIKRGDVNRPLTLKEMDNNLEFLHIKEWSVRSYVQGELVYITSEDIKRIYLCLINHTWDIYPEAQFTTQLGDTDIWLEISNNFELSNVLTGVSLSGETLTFTDITGGTIDIVIPTGSEFVFDEDLTVSLSNGKSFGKYVNGDVIPASGKTTSEILQLALVEALEPTVNLTSPTSIGFNQTAISNVLNFSYTINSLGASVSTVSLEWRRNNTGSWTVLSTNTGITTFTHTLTDTNFNTQPFNYRYIVTDTAGGTKTATVNLTPAAYVAPSISLSVVAPTLLSYETNSLRERGNIESNLSGTITRNSPNVALTSYKLQYRVNSGSWTDIGTSVSISGATPSISLTNDNNGTLTNSDTIDYRVLVTDVFQTTTGSTVGVTFRHVYYVGATSSNPLSEGDILSLQNPSLSFTNKSRTVTGFTANGGEYTYIVYNNSFGALSNIIQNGALPVLGAFTDEGSVNINSFYGASMEYRIYRSNSTAAFSNVTLTIS